MTSEHHMADGNGGEFISRDEFSTFERNVNRGFKQIGDQLGDLRSEIRGLAGEARKGPDLKLIVSTLGVFAMIVGAIGSIVAWGLKEQQAGMGNQLESYEGHSREHMDELRGLMVEHLQLSAGEHSGQGERLRALEREVFARSPRKCGSE